MAVEQAGFRKNRGTRNHITNIRIMMQKAREHKEPLFLGFIDFVKAFGMIIHNKMWKIMSNMGYPIHLIRLLICSIKNNKPESK